MREPRSESNGYTRFQLTISTPLLLMDHIYQPLNRRIRPQPLSQGPRVRQPISSGAKLQS
ncbi:hypothetical protein L484_014553 [Morus notabilis]|uniref:Uncharacterized protein n=1 Tax=Morus notabilis TaxID=981085 RepID=W9RTY8_9ROSA|nr:hypothetical protein L484_014553 [Morus notabilis]